MELKNYSQSEIDNAIDQFRARPTQCIEVEGSSNKLLGDMLCLSGAVLYGISNVCEEYVVKSHDHIEFLGMLGLFGSIINGIQLAIFERKQVALIKWDQSYLVLCLVGYGVCLFTLYVCMPLTMKLSSATAVNLSVLTADFYSLICGMYLFKYKFHQLYFLSFSLIIFGVVIFFMKTTNPTNSPMVDQEYREVSTVPESASKSGDQLIGPDAPGTSRSTTYNSLHSRLTYLDIENDSNNLYNAERTISHISKDEMEPDGYKRNGMITIEQSDWTKL
ncbi:Solute carrier family 35 member F1 [Nymphon striatum]|nr:Solute carrier family 35 member F1 [Nymphon striatum]